MTMSFSDATAACRPEALDALRGHLHLIDTTDGLVSCVTAVAMQEMPDADPAAVLTELDRLAEQVTDRLHTDSPQARLAHAHAVLFDELGFAGDTEHYDDPRNSYLPRVLDRKRGLPITLALIYKAVLERVGMTVHGVNAPGHFMAAVVSGDPGQKHAEMIVDVFAGGRALTDSQAIERIGEVLGRPAPHDRSLLAHATHAQWLLRIIQNLIAAFTRRDARPQLAAMTGLRAATLKHLGADPA